MPLRVKRKDLKQNLGKLHTEVSELDFSNCELIRMRERSLGFNSIRDRKNYA